MSEKTNKKDGKPEMDNSGLQFETFVVNGAQYNTLLTKKYKNRKKWEKANDKQMYSFIPGTILKVFVKDKQKIQKDQPLLIQEAMKMENTVFAPFDGTLKKVLIKEGDKVPKGLLMIEFE